jgi:flagellar motor switch protein FliM
MRPVRDFTGERALAVHSPELLSRAGIASGADGLPGATLTPARGDGSDNASAQSDPDAAHSEALAEFANDLCAKLAVQAQNLLGGRAPAASAENAELRSGAALEQAMRERMVHFRLDWSGMPRCLISFDCKAALTLTDRIFGGDGKYVDAQASEVPRSTMLAMEKVAVTLARPLPALLDPKGNLATQDAGLQDPQIEGHMKIAKLTAFPRAATCVSWTFTINQDDHDPWPFTISWLESDLKACLAPSGSAQENDALTGGRLGETAAHSCEAVPLELTATLAKMQLPLSRLANLKPGQTLPIPMHREVPLAVAGTTLAHGSIGTLDNQIAVRITRFP